MNNMVGFVRFCCVVVVLLSAVSVLSAQNLTAAIPVHDVEILVVHTNDTHSCIMPLSPNMPDTALADKGGGLRRVVLVDSLRAENPNMLLFDCGDFSQGSLYYNMFKGDVEVALMNRMRYDACTIGNHEFDYGVENMARLFAAMDFPVVCCNYDFRSTVLSEFVKPYVLVERGGLKIGVLGVSPRLDGLVAKDDCLGVEYLSPIQVVNSVAEHLKFVERCDLIICLSHLGWDYGEMNDKILSESTRHIDVILGGHSHTDFEMPELLVNADGARVVYSQMGKNGVYVGAMTLVMEPIRK